MKRICILVITLLFGLILSSCNENNNNTMIYEEKLIDVNFTRGFEVSALHSASMSYTWWQYQDKAQGEPLWKLSQFCDLSRTRKNYDSTRNDLTLSTMFEDGYGIQKNDGNVEILTNISGSKEARYNLDTKTLSLNIDTTKEYIDQATSQIVKRSEGEDWVHMIIEQSAGGIVVNDYEEIILEIDFTITKNEVIDASFGTAQFQWIFSVKDMKSVINDYFWFNFTFFDALYESFPGTQIYDGGKADATGKFIYAPKTSTYLNEPLEIGKKYSVKINIRPFIENAFSIAQNKGALTESLFSDMALSSFNLGWEVSNVSKVGVDISNLSLKVGKKQ